MLVDRTNAHILHPYHTLIDSSQPFSMQPTLVNGFLELLLSDGNSNTSQNCSPTQSFPVEPCETNGWPLDPIIVEQGNSFHDKYSHKADPCSEGKFYSGPISSMLRQSQKECLHEVRNMFPDPTRRHCVICKRTNMSFKKNYFIHAQNIQLYKETFPHIPSITYGPVCSTDFNKFWRFSRGEYIPSPDGSGRTIKKHPQSKKRVHTSESYQRKKRKETIHGSTRVLFNFHCTNKDFEPLTTLWKLEHISFSQNVILIDTFKEEVIKSLKEALECYASTLPQSIDSISIDSIQFSKDQQLVTVDECLLQTIIMSNMLSDGDSFLIGISFN